MARICVNRFIKRSLSGRELGGRCREPYALYAFPLRCSQVQPSEWLWLLTPLPIIEVPVLNDINLLCIFLVFSKSGVGSLIKGSVRRTFRERVYPDTPARDMMF